MEDVQDLINNEKAIIINQFFNAVEKSEGKLESSIQDIKVKYGEIKDKYEELKATNERESQSKNVSIVMNQNITIDYSVSITYLQDHGGCDQEPDEHTRSPNDNAFSWGKRSSLAYEDNHSTWCRRNLDDETRIGSSADPP